MKRLIFSLAIVMLVGCHAPKVDKETNETLLHYQCEKQQLDVRLNNEIQQVKLIIDGKEQQLHQVVSASGAKYSNDDYSFWSKGDQAMILRGDTIILNNCALIP